MKFLLLGALLIGATLCQSTPHGYEDLIGKLNFERRAFAYRMNISNMYELHWDEALNPDPLPSYDPTTSQYRVMLIGRDQNTIASEVHVVDKLLSELHNDPTFWESRSYIDGNTWPHWPFEHFLPTQTSIGCESREMMYTWESPWKGYNVYRTRCYLGPENSYTKKESWKHGWPGSACGSDTDFHGMCRPKHLMRKKAHSVLHLQNGRDTVSKLNFERREYAKAMNISNMYKLEWNSALSKVKNNLDSSLISNFQKIYVFGNKDAYYYENHALKDSKYQFSGDISNWDEQLVEEHENGTLGFLAHLVPEQKALGCYDTPYVLKNREIRGSIFNLEYTATCYIGPERSLKNSVWKFGAPGTGCGSDKVEDGLCVGSLPEGYKPFGEFSPRTTPPPITTSSSPPEELKTSPPQAAPEVSLPEGIKTPSPTVESAPENSAPEDLRTPSTHIKTAPEVSNQQKYEELVAKLNYDRRELAKAMDVANMFKLNSLSKAGTIVTFSLDEIRIAAEKELTRDIDRLAARGTLKEWIDSLEDQIMMTLEQFLPTQTEIGCAPFGNIFTFWTYSNVFDVEYSTICVLTPTSSFKDAVTKTGPAGSECGGCQVEDGLCIQNSEGDKLQCLH